MIAVGFGQEAATSIRCDPIPKARLRPHEPSIRVLPLPLCFPLTVYEHPRHVASLRSAHFSLSARRPASPGGLSARSGLAAFACQHFSLSGTAADSLCQDILASDG